MFKHLNNAINKGCSNIKKEIKKCKTHKTKELLYYCNKCKLEKCVDCINNKCKDHQTYHINTTYLEKKAIIDKGLKELDKKKEFLNKKANDDEKKLTLSDDKIQPYINSIDKSKDDMKCQLIFQQYLSNKNVTFPAKTDYDDFNKK